MKEKKYSEKVQETIDKLKSAVAETAKQATKKEIDMSLEKPYWKRIDYKVKGRDKIEKFNNISILNENENEKELNIVEEAFTKIRISNYFKNEADNFANVKKTIVIDDKYDKNIYINMKLDKQNSELVDIFNIKMLEDTKAKIYISYTSDEELEYYHNGYINVISEKNSKLDLIVIQDINLKSENFLGIDFDIKEDASINYYGVEFGANTNVVSVNTNLLENRSKAKILPIYLSDLERKNDFEYTLNFHGRECIGDIDARGVTKDKAIKVFRGNLIFEKFSTKSEGSEKEFSILLDKTVKAHSIPTLFCDEDDVIGAHSANIGKIDTNKLFYLMSRGFSEKNAKRLIVNSSFRTVFDEIDNEDILNKLNLVLERRL